MLGIVGKLLGSVRTFWELLGLLGSAKNRWDLLDSVGDWWELLLFGIVGDSLEVLGIVCWEVLGAVW